MKTAEELFAKYELKYPTYNDDGILIQEDPTDCIGYDNFLKALAEDRKQVKDLIDEMTPEVSEDDEENNWSRLDIAMKIAVKQKLIGLKEKL